VTLLPSLLGTVEGFTGGCMVKAILIILGMVAAYWVGHSQGYALGHTQAMRAAEQAVNSIHCGVTP
jgi:hypothetical protein